MKVSDFKKLKLVFEFWSSQLIVDHSDCPKRKAQEVQQKINPDPQALLRWAAWMDIHGKF
jgi:hypothetical protein